MTVALRGWRLFGVLIAASTCVILDAMRYVDLDTRPGAQTMIRWGVRCALPYFIAAFIASSLATLWPGRASRWLLSNRRYIGIAFACAFGWQLVFIVWFAVADSAYFERTFLTFTTIALGVAGYGFLYLMCLTSFKRFGRRLSGAQWRALHKTGMYVLWLILTLGYILHAADRPSIYYYAASASLVSCQLLRMLAWRRRSASVDLWSLVRTSCAAALRDARELTLIGAAYLISPVKNAPGRHETRVGNERADTSCAAVD